MAFHADQFFPLTEVANITGIWPKPYDEPGPQAILKEYQNNAVGVGLNAARHILLENTSVSGSCTAPDHYYQGENAMLTLALSTIFTNRQVNVRPDRAELATSLPPEATTTFTHASNLDLINDNSLDARAWKQTFNFQSGPNMDIVEKSRYRNLATINALLFALYPAYTHLSSLDQDGYYSLFRHEERITILRYHNFKNKTHGGTNFIVIPSGRDEHNERSTGRSHQTRTLVHNAYGEPGFFPDPLFYDEPSQLLILSQDPSRRLKWFAQELRTQTRKPQSHRVDFDSHHLETLRYYPSQVIPNDAARITTDMFNALFEDYDFTSKLLRAHGLWGTVFAQNKPGLVRQSLERAENTFFSDTSTHEGVFSKLSSTHFAELMAIALPIPLDQFTNNPATSDKIVATSVIGMRSPHALWANQQFTLVKNALEKTLRLANTQRDTIAVKMLQRDISYFSEKLSKSSWN